MSGDDGRFGPIKLPMSNVLTGPDVEDLPALYKIASDWRRLLELAGVRSKASLAIGDLWDSRWKSEEHTSELQSLMRISYAVFCLKKKKYTTYSHKTRH